MQRLTFASGVDFIGTTREGKPVSAVTHLRNELFFIINVSSSSKNLMGNEPLPIQLQSRSKS